MNIRSLPEGAPALVGQWSAWGPAYIVEARDLAGFRNLIRGPREAVLETSPAFLLGFVPVLRLPLPIVSMFGPGKMRMVSQLKDHGLVSPMETIRLKEACRSVEVGPEGFLVVVDHEIHSLDREACAATMLIEWLHPLR